jgi:hypothetical protein
MFDVHRDADVPPGKTTPAARGRRRRRRGRTGRRRSVIFWAKERFMDF